MQTTILAHFDGKVFVPDEPVELPVGEPIVLRITQGMTSVEERIQKLENYVGSVVPPAGFDARRISREDLYE